MKDLDLDNCEILVCDGKGPKDQRTMLSARSVQALRPHLAATRPQHQLDLAAGLALVSLPDGLTTKYPATARERARQWVFPATRHYRDRRTGELRRHHLHKTVIQRAARVAARQATS